MFYGSLLWYPKHSSIALDDDKVLHVFVSLSLSLTMIVFIFVVFLPIEKRPFELVRRRRARTEAPRC
jgi:hypothetical protein